MLAERQMIYPYTAALRDAPLPLANGAIPAAA